MPPITQNEGIIQVAMVGASITHGIFMDQLLFEIYPTMIKIVGSIAVTAAGEIGEATTVVDV